MPEIPAYEFYKSELTDLHRKLVVTLGAITVCQLMQRAIVEAEVRYPALAQIRAVEDGLVFDDADPLFAAQSPSEVQAAFSAFYAVTIVLLARLLGQEIASRLTGGPLADDLLKGGLIGR